MSDQDRVWQLMKSIDFCMFTTLAGDGMRSRPMSSIIDADARAVHFLSDAKASKDDEIERDPRVLLAYSNGANTFVSVSGTARLSNDRDLIKRLWNPGAQVFWPQGPETADVVVIAVTPSSAEYWDGDNGLMSSIKFAIALATGTVPDMGDSGKVRL